MQINMNETAEAFVARVFRFSPSTPSYVLNTYVSLARTANFRLATLRGMKSVGAQYVSVESYPGTFPTYINGRPGYPGSGGYSILDVARRTFTIRLELGTNWGASVRRLQPPAGSAVLSLSDSGFLTAFNTLSESQRQAYRTNPFAYNLLRYENGTIELQSAVFRDSFVYTAAHESGHPAYPGIVEVNGQPIYDKRGGLNQSAAEYAAWKFLQPFGMEVGVTGHSPVSMADFDSQGAAAFAKLQAKFPEIFGSATYSSVTSNLASEPFDSQAMEQGAALPDAALASKADLVVDIRDAASGFDRRVSAAEMLGEILVVSDGSFIPTDGNGEPRSAAAFPIAEFASIFGSTLGQQLAGDDLTLGTLSGALLGTIAWNVGQSIDVANGWNVIVGRGSEVRIAETANEVWADFPNELAEFTANAAIGAASSYLALELGEALGLEGFGAELFSSGAGTLLQHVLSDLVAEIPPLSFVKPDAPFFGEGGVGVDALASAFVSFFATKLGSLVVQPQTQAAAVLSSLGAAAGTIGGYAGGLIGQTAATIAFDLFGKAALAFVKGLFTAIPGLGVFIGFVLGAFIGNLFGSKKPKVPTAGAEVALQIPLAHYELGSVTQANGGNLSLARSMGLGARDTLNGLIGVITHDDPEARVSNTTALLQKYGHTGNQLWVQYDVNLNGALASNEKFNVNSADEAVDKGVLWAIPNTRIVGGDLFLKRALYNMTRHPGQVTSVAQLAGDLQIADDYAFYLQNRAIIDAVIAEPWTSMSAAQQDFYTNNKAFMTRALAQEQIPANDNRLPTVALAC